MKKVKILLSLSAFAFFVACHNPYSSTSQEPRDESEETMEHGKDGKDKEHEMKGGTPEMKGGEHMNGDTNHIKMMDTTGAKAPKDTIHGTGDTTVAH